MSERINEDGTVDIIPSGAYLSDKFEYVNQQLRQHLELANVEIDKVKEKVNELVAIVHNDNKDWSLKRICDYIAGRNDDFEVYGFSSRTIHNYLNEKNRQLIDAQKQQNRKPKYQPSAALEELRQKKGTYVHDNVLEQSVESLQQKDLEDSSTTTTEEEEKEAEDDNMMIINPGLLDAKVREISDLQQENDVLKQIFTALGTYEGKEQDLPLLITVNPENQKILKIELNKARAKELARF